MFLQNWGVWGEGSAIFRPKSVNIPSSSKEPKVHSDSKALIMVSTGLETRHGSFFQNECTLGNVPQLIPIIPNLYLKNEKVLLGNLILQLILNYQGALCFRNDFCAENWKKLSSDTKISACFVLAIAELNNIVCAVFVQDQCLNPARFLNLALLFCKKKCLKTNWWVLVPNSCAKQFPVQPKRRRVHEVKAQHVLDAHGLTSMDGQRRCSKPWDATKIYAVQKTRTHQPFWDWNLKFSRCSCFFQWYSKWLELQPL